MLLSPLFFFFFFFFNDTATTEIYTLSLHDALPICREPACPCKCPPTLWTPPNAAKCLWHALPRAQNLEQAQRDRKSTRLNSSHLVISYAVFCLKKKKRNKERFRRLIDDAVLDVKQ